MDAGLEPTALAVADVNRDGRPDLLVGNPFGDILVLLGSGDGTFRPDSGTDRHVALAVADLNGDGTQEMVYASQNLDQVSIKHCGSGTTVVGDRARGVLAPEAVKLADLDGDGIRDLVVANSGSNDVLVYPGGYQPWNVARRSSFKTCARTCGIR
jgi:hypothetical protein